MSLLDFVAFILDTLYANTLKGYVGKGLFILMSPATDEKNATLPFVHTLQ